MRDLLLVHLDNKQYGVWKDDILSIRDVRTLHRIPLSPACIAGMSIIDDRTVTLADLPVCIGCGPAAPDKKTRILLLASPGKITGFLVAGDIDTISVPPDAVFPIPEYLKTEVIDSCAVRDSIPIPIINVVRLCAHLVKEDQEPMAPALAVPAGRAAAACQAGIRVFELKGELFAAASRGMEDLALKPGRITALSLLPEFVRGITVHENTLLPVIDLCQRIKRQACSSDALMVVAEVDGLPFGLLIDADRGVLPASDVLISDLPPVARTAWLSRTIVRSGELIPLVDDITLLLQQQGAAGQKPRNQRYVPDSAFHELFRRQDAAVVEFLLLGAKHALPKSEVEDIIPFKPLRPIPDTPEIVVGIVEHNGTVLPVLDLAMVFGRRSLVKTEWSMILVRNGDFRALVVTEAVIGETRLPVDTQRAVPILLPHRVVYGCYPAADGVRLIMNVYAMTVHFEKSLVKELLPALSSEMKMARAEIVHTLLDEQAAVAASPAIETDPEQAEEHPSEAAERVADMGISPAAAPEQEKQAVAEPADQAPDVMAPSAAVTEQAATFPTEEQHGQSESMAATESVQGGTAGGNVLPTQAETSIAEPAEESVPGERKAEGIEVPKPAETAAEAPVTTTATEEGAAAAITAGQEPLFMEPQVIPVKTEDEIQSVQAGEETSETPVGGTIAEPAIPQQIFPKEEPEAAAGSGNRVGQAEEPLLAEEPALEPQQVTAHQQTEKAAVESRTGETAGRHAGIQPGPVQPAFFNQRPGSATESARPSRLSSVSSDSSSRRRGKSGFWYAVAGAVLFGLLFFAVFFKKSIPEKRAQENAAPKATALKTEEAAPIEKKKPSLELDVPASRTVVDEQAYTVVKGDTLWRIAERFTGDPFNYPRIAGENKIANADLIFPGQKIRLKKK